MRPSVGMSRLPPACAPAGVFAMPLGLLHAARNHGDSRRVECAEGKRDAVWGARSSCRPFTSRISTAAVGYNVGVTGELTSR